MIISDDGDDSDARFSGWRGTHRGSPGRPSLISATQWLCADRVCSISFAIAVRSVEVAACSISDAPLRKNSKQKAREGVVLPALPTTLPMQTGCVGMRRQVSAVLSICAINPLVSD